MIKQTVFVGGGGKASGPVKTPRIYATGMHFICFIRIMLYLCVMLGTLCILTLFVIFCTLPSPICIPFSSCVPCFLPLYILFLLPCHFQKVSCSFWIYPAFQHNDPVSFISILPPFICSLFTLYVSLVPSPLCILFSLQTYFPLQLVSCSVYMHHTLSSMYPVQFICIFPSPICILLILQASFPLLYVSCSDCMHLPSPLYILFSVHVSCPLSYASHPLYTYPASLSDFPSRPQLDFPSGTLIPLITAPASSSSNSHH